MFLKLMMSRVLKKNHRVSRSSQNNYMAFLMKRIIFDCTEVPTLRQCCIAWILQFKLNERYIILSDSLPIDTYCKFLRLVLN